MRRWVPAVAPFSGPDDFTAANGDRVARQAAPVAVQVGPLPTEHHVRRAPARSVAESGRVIPRADDQPDLTPGLTKLAVVRQGLVQAYVRPPGQQACGWDQSRGGGDAPGNPVGVARVRVGQPLLEEERPAARTPPGRRRSAEVPVSARRWWRSRRAMASRNQVKPRAMDSMAAVPVSVASRARARPGYKNCWKSPEPTYLDRHGPQLRRRVGGQRPLRVTEIARPRRCCGRAACAAQPQRRSGCCCRWPSPTGRAWLRCRCGGSPQNSGRARPRCTAMSKPARSCSILMTDAVRRVNTRCAEPSGNWSSSTSLRRRLSAAAAKRRLHAPRRNIR